MTETVALEGLLGSGAAFLLSYPRYDGAEVERRVRELRGLGVEALELRGRHVVGGVSVLGKGHVGVVVAARLGGVSVALKIRRTDADRESLEAEASSLRLANGASVGPVCLGSSSNFLVMELVEGDYLVDWLGGLGPSEGGLLGRVLGRLLWKARRLDVVGLDHGELSRADRHVIVEGGEPRIVDFESASTARRCSNVTSIAHYLFLNRRMRGLVREVLPLPSKDGLFRALRRYKEDMTDEGFMSVLVACGLAAQGF